MKKQNKRSLRSVSFLVISFLLHLLLVLAFSVYHYFVPDSPPDFSRAEQDKKSEITFIDINDIDLKKNGALVEQEDPTKKTEKARKDAKYLSQQNQIVEKETRAAHHGDFQNTNNAAPNIKNSSSQKSTAASMALPTTQASEAEDVKTYENGGVVVDQKNKPKKAKTFADLRPSQMENMAESSMASVSQTNDYLKDVAVSAQTQLNTREYLYYSYFSRIKKKLRQHWEPMVHARVRQLVMRGRDLASVGEKTTRCIITLDDRGGLTRVQVLTTSGLEDLDDAALGALRAAAPFPNPPKDLIHDGLVTINWDFILET